MHDEPGPLEPDVRAQAWKLVAVGATERPAVPDLIISALCVALLDLRDRKMDRLP